MWPYGNSVKELSIVLRLELLDFFLWSLDPDNNKVTDIYIIQLSVF